MVQAARSALLRLGHQVVSGVEHFIVPRDYLRRNGRQLSLSRALKESAGIALTNHIKELSQARAAQISLLRRGNAEPVRSPGLGSIRIDRLRGLLRKIEELFRVAMDSNCQISPN